MSKKVLIVLTSHNTLGTTGKQTGYYLPELTHPFFSLVDQGIAVDIASIKGGKAPMDEESKDLLDPANKRFLDSNEYRELIENTLPLSDINAQDYDAILFTGGHGTMWDFPQDPAVALKSSEIYEAGGIVAAVCHGPAALLNIKLNNGKYLIDGKKVTGFSNNEEDAMQLSKIMPFLLETELQKKGAIYSYADLWKEYVVVDGRLITGQNPASASKVGAQIVELLKIE